jgi:hypothetical protein
VDMGLVRGIHESVAKQKIVKLLLHLCQVLRSGCPRDLLSWETRNIGLMARAACNDSVFSGRPHRTDRVGQRSWSSLPLSPMTTLGQSVGSINGFGGQSRAWA